MASAGLLRVRTLEGPPITIGSRALVPQAYLVSCGRRRAIVTRTGFGGRGWACGLLLPSAIIERHIAHPDGTAPLRRIPVPDRMVQALLAMAGVALAVALFCALVERLLPGPGAERRGE